MELRQLRYFLAIAETGSFSRAAERLRIAQPALSRQISAMEKEFGIEFFVRHGRGVSLTEAGEILFERCNSVIREIDRLHEEVRAEDADPSGEIAVGIPPSLRPMLTTRTLLRYRRDYPRVLLKVREGVSATLRDAVLNGQLDVAVMSSLEQTGSLERKPFLTQPQYLVGPGSAGLRFDQAVPASRLDGLPLVVTSVPNGLRLTLDTFCAANEIEPQIEMELNSLNLMADMVCHGEVYTVLPQCCLFEVLNYAPLSAAPIEGLSVTWMLVHSNERFQTTAVKKFIATLLEECRACLEDEKWAGSISVY